jgi:hypothetical protein
MMMEVALNGGVESTPAATWNPFLPTAEFLESSVGLILVSGFIALDVILVLVTLSYEAVYCTEESTFTTVMSYISFGLCCLFMLELLVKFLGFGMQYFRANIMHSVEAFVIIASFVMEFAFLNDSTLSEIVSLLVLVRLWRVFRVVYAASDLIEESEHKKLQALQFEIQELKAQLETMRTRTLAEA